jgi:exopolyphosphatase/guanosine-5'-triphosphate,3'-diphosphate pyrophosphatase
MVAEVAQYVAPFAAEHGADLRDMHMLGTSGTVTTLAGVFLNLPRYDRRRIDGIWMNNSDVTSVIQRLLGMTYQERASNNCISVERADLVLAGCAILDAIRDAFPLPRLRVADRGLREGMLVEMMREDGALRSC